MGRNQYYYYYYIKDKLALLRHGKLLTDRRKYKTKNNREIKAEEWVTWVLL